MRRFIGNIFIIHLPVAERNDRRFSQSSGRLFRRVKGVNGEIDRSCDTGLQYLHKEALNTHKINMICSVRYINNM